MSGPTVPATPATLASATVTGFSNPSSTGGSGSTDGAASTGVGSTGTPPSKMTSYTKEISFLIPPGPLTCAWMY